VALVAPAGPVDEATIERAARRCRALGLEPVPGQAVRARKGYLAGTDAERAADLSRALTDADAVWALRGGYGNLRTLDRVDLSPLRERPKPFIGFSDNTVVHLALYREGVVSFHGPHAGYEHFPATTEAVFRDVVMSADPAGALARPPGASPVPVVAGEAEGPLVGGNLSLLAATCGTRYQPDTRGAILFIEDVAEPLYRIDRMLSQLRLAGLFDDVAAVAFGEFSHTAGLERPGVLAPGSEPDAAIGDAERDATTASLSKLFGELLGPLGVPVALGLPFGHGRENWTLPLGVPARLDADAGTLELLEGATDG
jgi:muramoyltetrapeptide carboxypeptidase